VRNLGEDHPAVIAAMGGKSPEERAQELMRGTLLADVECRKYLYEHPKAIEYCADPMIAFAKAIDPFARALRKRYENELVSVQKDAYSKIAQIFFDRDGESVYPDGTFTMRLSIGSMIGYEEDGLYVEPMTDIGGIFEKASKHQSRDPYTLPDRWVKNEETLNQATPFNFVSTNDMIGGNSGSPVINIQGEVVGLVFDGNAHAFLWDFQFDQEVGRSVSVHSSVIIESLRSVYGAGRLADEITGSGSR